MYGARIWLGTFGLAVCPGAMHLASLSLSFLVPVGEQLQPSGWEQGMRERRCQHLWDPRAQPISVAILHPTEVSWAAIVHGPRVWSYAHHSDPTTPARIVHQKGTRGCHRAGEERTELGPTPRSLCSLPGLVLVFLLGSWNLGCVQLNTKHEKSKEYSVPETSQIYWGAEGCLPD